MPSAKQRAPRKSLSPNPNVPLERVDPRWLIKALVLSLIAALACGYATLCCLEYQGEWQLILHPSYTVDRTPAVAGIPYTDVRFGASETGQPRLTGWWVPAESQNQNDAGHSATILYLHNGSGSLADAVPMLATLHRANLNVFAVDYRSFGASDDSAHPSETRMVEDAAASLDYLTSTRHIPIRNIVPYGVELGAFLAATLARNHPDLRAVVLDNPAVDPLSTSAAGRSLFLPVRLLSGRPFDITKLISTLATPKLLIAGGPSTLDAARDPGSLPPALIQRAAMPSSSITLPVAGSEGDYQAALKHFLHQNLPAAP